MAPFDPETGERIREAEQPRGPRPANPWLRALTGAWSAALLVAAVLGVAALAVGSPASGLDLDGARDAAALLSAAGWFLTVAVGAVIAQLAARAAAWRPPDA